MRRVLKIILWGVALLLVSVVVLPIGVGVCLYHTADLREPSVVVDTAAYPLVRVGDSLRRVGHNTLLRNRYGLWEARISGSAVERGTVLGRLAESEIAYQEQVFVDQIRRIIPSDRYLWFLHKLTLIFNRTMAQHITDELREEIYAMSYSCSHEFDQLGSPYLRQLNYHAAHDIGHAMQEYMLVGCSSFAVWGNESADGELLVGRNFDFWVGDDFARNKFLLIVEPDAGYRFVSVTWPGMVGVLSGMNERGLTVTINAAKGPIPTASATPISLLAREILQYAATIDEAFEIAEKRQTFVSESILVASAEDGCAALIEKSPDRMALYRADGERIICTNHYQSAAFSEDVDNIRNIATSDSRYRWERLEELLDRSVPLTAEQAASILRNTKGHGGVDIGLTNEKAINQCIAHHGVIFQPAQRRMWLSTDPWQAGAMLCYELDELFAHETPFGRSMAAEKRTIAPDTRFLEQDYPRALKHRELMSRIGARLRAEKPVDPSMIDSLVRNNPCHYAVHDLAGDVALMRGDTLSACANWRTALEKEIPRETERETIEQKISEYGTR